MRIVDRVGFLKEISAGKNILHLGCVDHDSFTYKDKMARASWLHEELNNVAANLIGIDILPEYDELIKKQGYDIRYGNVEDFKGIEIDMKFDYIIAGEIIEHLFNQGLFLDAVRKFMSTGTKLVITTPNCFSLRKIYPAFFNKEFNRDDHTLWHSQDTLTQVLRLKGYEIDEICFYAFMKQKGPGPYIQKKFYGFLPRLADGLIFIVH
jgi:hypothetical protein